MRRVALLTAALMFGCSGESGTAGEGNDGTAWEFDGGSADGGDTEENNGAAGANNGSSPANNSTASNNGVGANNGAADAGSPQNNGAVDAGSSQNNSAIDAGAPANNGLEGSPCMVNSECSSELICCQGFSGNATCEADCFTGGLCGGNDAECGRGEECCDLGDAVPATCLDQCGGGGGGTGTACMVNTDCTDTEVCCPGFDGSRSCQPQDSCLSGGTCEQDSDCRGMQSCCDINVAKVCLDRCRF